MTLAVILQLVVETDLAAAAIRLVTRNLMNRAGKKPRFTSTENR
jgi:hypothetical protein